jgi:hypothetical protein
MMTARDAVMLAQGYTRVAVWVYLMFALVSLAFGAVTILSPDVYETIAYADKRKVMSIGYSLVAVTMLLAVLHLNARSNAALTLGQALQGEEAGGGNGAVFRRLSALWALFFMAAIIIVVNYCVLIYAVDGGLF